ncbi:hypothetical protein B7494_g7040 [Chlorociboria aeruginascens]|nr:hypothetical protein B7494_g7040 [Chlorociboria aeruginascens]
MVQARQNRAPGTQWNTKLSSSQLEPVELSRYPSKDSTGTESELIAHTATTNLYDQSQSLALYPDVSQVSFHLSDADGRSVSPSSSDGYAPTQLDMQNFEQFTFPGGEDLSGPHSMYRQDSVSGAASQPRNISLTAGPSVNLFPTAADETFVNSLMPDLRGLSNNTRVSSDTVVYNPLDSPIVWDGTAFLESQRSSPSIEETWALPPQILGSETNSPLEYSPTESHSPNYTQELSESMLSPTYTMIGGRPLRKPVRPRLSKVTSDLASSRQQKLPGSSENVEESYNLVGRSSLEIDNTARDHPLYAAGAPSKEDGLYHCPFEGQASCQHKPEKLKCNYDKFIDSHLKPYRCKVTACGSLQFSSTACLLRHEREAHAMHGHGLKPFFCKYEGCERSIPGNGFPRHWNLRDHMKRVHNDPGASRSNADGSPPPPSNGTIKPRKRKAEATDAPHLEKAQVKRIQTPPVVKTEPSMVDYYHQSEERLLEAVKQLRDPKAANNMDMLRKASDCIKTKFFEMMISIDFHATKQVAETRILYNEASINLTRMLARLQKILINPDSSTESRLRVSSYEREKIGTNIKYAEGLLLQLEQDALTIKVQTKKHETQANLIKKRDIIQRLLERLQELNEVNVPLQGESTLVNDFQLSEVEEDESSEGEDLLGEETPSETTEGQISHDENNYTPDTLDSVSPWNGESNNALTEHFTLSEPVSTLRARAPRPDVDSESRAQSTGISTATTEALLTHNRTEQETLTASLLSMAQQLKATSNAFASSLESEKPLIDNTMEGLDKNERGMEAARKRMGYLRTMTEGRGWWGRMLIISVLKIYFLQHKTMPLITITGYPTSGKTHRASQLHAHFTSQISSLPASSPFSSLRVHLISDHTLAIPRSVYNLETKDSHERSNNASEKDARATIYAAVKRVLSTKDVVIVDGGNYIKGWRYQLYCEAKAVRTTHCVVHVGTPVQEAREVNEKRLKAAEVEVKEEERAYDPECWENLVFRYEEPNAFTRWDSPLFTILWEDVSPPFDAIWETLIGSEAEGGKKLVRPNQATVLKKVSGEDYLYELDKVTQGILNRILEWAKDHSGEGGGEVDVSDGKEELVVELPANPVGLPGLQRLRRQFIGLNRRDAVDAGRIKESFVGYLNDSFQGV